MKWTLDYRRGLMAGFGLPVLMYFMLMGIYQWIDSQGWLQGDEVSHNFRERTLALVAFGVNIFLVEYFRRNFNYERMRGVVIPTLIYTAIWLYFYAGDLF